MSARRLFGDQRGSFVLLIVIPVLMILVAGGVLGWLWWNRDRSAKTPVVAPIASPMASESATVCAEVITPAIDPVTGQCREFGTPCEVPKNFLLPLSCTPEALNWREYRPSSGVFTMRYPADWDFFVRQTSVDVLGFSNLITQVAFDDKATGKRNPFGELLGRIELSWLGSGQYADKTVQDFVASYYQNASPTTKDVNIGQIPATRVEHTNCSANKGCIDYVFKHEKTFYVLRALSLGDKSEDEKIILTMLGSWNF